MKKILSFLFVIGSNTLVSANDLNQTPIEDNKSLTNSGQIINKTVQNTTNNSQTPPKIEQNFTKEKVKIAETKQSLSETNQTKQISSKIDKSTLETNQSLLVDSSINPIETNQSLLKKQQNIQSINNSEVNQSSTEKENKIENNQTLNKTKQSSSETNQSINETNKTLPKIEQSSNEDNQSSIIEQNLTKAPQANPKSRFIDQSTDLLQKQVKQYPNLNKLYKELFYTPIWVAYDGSTNFAKSLLKQIDQDPTIPNILNLHQKAQKIEDTLNDINSNSTLQEKIDTELKMSKLYLTYMNYLIYGGINWKAFDKKLKALTKKYKIKVGWEHYAPPVTPSSLLVDSVMSGDLDSAFKKAEPKRFKYQQLKKRLIDYIQLSKEGALKPIPSFREIHPGQRDSKVALIRKELVILGDLIPNSENNETKNDPKLYDKSLQEAVKHFKVRHGLKATATIDKETRYWLNLPIQNRIELLRLNLDRIKWLWRKEAKIRIELNIPAFRLYFYEGKHLVDTIRVITGKPNHPTPSFHNTMQYIVVNPYWKIPESIVKSEMLRHLISDPYYYERRGKVLHADWDEDSPRVDPGSVNWAKYRTKGKHIPYYFMQLPGTSNALGKIKFLFPNKYSVYIHDTPNKKLFFENTRAFSHGCMRIQKPRELLKVLALYNDNIDVESIMKQLKTRKKDTIVLKQSIPVDIIYLTAFIDDYGNLNFRKDVYGYDKFQMEYYAYNPNHKIYKSSSEDNHSKKSKR